MRVHFDHFTILEPGAGIMATAQIPTPKERRSDQAHEAPAFDLQEYGITVTDIRRNLSPAALYAEAIREDPKCDIADSGALIAFSGTKTGRSPTDKRVV